MLLFIWSFGFCFWTDVANKLNFEEDSIQENDDSQSRSGSQVTLPCNHTALHKVAVSAVGRKKKYRAESSKTFTGNIIHLCPIFPPLLYQFFSV